MKQTHSRVKYFVDSQSRLIHGAVIFMALSAVFRLAGCWGMLGDAFYATSQIALPLVANLLYIICILLLGRKLFCLSAVPVLLGIVYFIVRAFGFESWIHTVLCVMLYLIVALLYTATVLGYIPSKLPLVGLFVLPFLYHLFVQDFGAIRSGAEIRLSVALEEISVLCILVSLILSCWAMQKKDDDSQTQLPKIKDPKVLVKDRKEEKTETGELDEKK